MTIATQESLTPQTNDDLVDKTREELMEMVKSLRVALRRKENTIESLNKEINRYRKVSYDALPEIDPYDR